MRRTLVWDLPTRLLHWLLAASVAVAAAIAFTAGEKSAAFQVHALLGLVAGFVVVLRLVWGVVGTRYARLGAFAVSPGALLRYLGGVVRGGGERPAGHNPAAALAALAMLALVAGLAVSGLLMPSSRRLEELHEVLAFGLLAAVGVHLAGVVLHTLRHREPIALSMIDGKKEVAPALAIRSSRPLAGVVAAALVVGFGALLLAGHDARTGQVKLLGATVSLREAGSPGDLEAVAGPRRERDDDRDD